MAKTGRRSGGRASWMNTTPNSSHYSPFSRLETHTQPPTPDVNPFSQMVFAGEQV